jgi:hypothetical protein
MAGVASTESTLSNDGAAVGATMTRVEEALHCVA